MKKLFLVFLFGIFATVKITAQSLSITEYLEIGLTENDLAKKLPPLDTLIKLAKKNNPFLKSFDSEKELGEGEVYMERRAWMQYLSIEAGYGYGVFDNLSDQQIAGDPGNQTLISSVQSRFNVGASAKIPISAFLNRRRSIKNAQLEAEKFKFKKLEAENELYVKVTVQYSDLLRMYRLLFVNNSILDAFKAQTERAEKEFANGVINVSEYTRMQQMINAAVINVETQKAEFYKAFMTLENTIGADLKI